MLVLLITFFSFFLLLSKSLRLKPLPSWATDVRSLLSSNCLFQEFAHLLVCFLKNCRSVSSCAGNFPLIMSSSSSLALLSSSSKKKRAAKVENVEETEEPLVLDLPELALECILGKLPPAGLRSMAAVCSSMRERCRSDHLWERHMSEKWGRVLGRAARKEWELYLAALRKDAIGCVPGAAAGKHRRWLNALSCVCPVSWFRSRIDGGGVKPVSPVPDESVMSWYLSMESGKFWFPAQVYNREHGHVGFMLSCYDAELSYDFQTDTFHARYPPHGRRTVVLEAGVQWDRIRAPPVDTPAHDLHVSDCLNDLRPGDHIEIQWRRNKEFPYGWWYGVVGHLESCDGSEHFCRCPLSDTVVLEFKQYTPGSRWRQALINRKDHREEGSEADGFYGGIRKLRNKDEISKWRQLWPTDVLE